MPIAYGAQRNTFTIRTISLVSIQSFSVEVEGIEPPMFAFRDQIYILTQQSQQLPHFHSSTDGIRTRSIAEPQSTWSAKVAYRAMLGDKAPACQNSINTFIVFSFRVRD